MVVGLIVGLSHGLDYGLISGSIFGLLFGSLLGLAQGASGRRVFSKEILSVETLQWSWSAARAGCSRNLVPALGMGLGTGLVWGLSVWLVVELGDGLVQGLQSREIDLKTMPNQGIRRSARNAVPVGLVSGLGIGLRGWLIFGPVWGLGGGLAGGLASGGDACLQHLTLRLILVRHHVAPWRYVAFLDYAAERILLRKVGGGYSFIHRLLQDYFAAVYEQSGEGAHPETMGPGRSMPR